MALCEAGFRYDSEVPKNGPSFGEFGEEIHELVYTCVPHFGVTVDVDDLIDTNTKLLRAHIGCGHRS